MAGWSQVSQATQRPSGRGAGGGHEVPVVDQRHHGGGSGDRLAGRHRHGHQPVVGDRTAVALLHREQPRTRPGHPAVGVAAAPTVGPLEPPATSPGAAPVSATGSRTGRRAAGAVDPVPLLVGLVHVEQHAVRARWPPPPPYSCTRLRTLTPVGETSTGGPTPAPVPRPPPGARRRPVGSHTSRPSVRRPAGRSRLTLPAAVRPPTTARATIRAAAGRPGRRARPTDRLVRSTHRVSTVPAMAPTPPPPGRPGPGSGTHPALPRPFARLRGHPDRRRPPGRRVRGPDPRPSTTCRDGDGRRSPSTGRRSTTRTGW